MAVRKQAKNPAPTPNELLARLEQTIPCPVNPEQFYCSLFPPEFVATWPIMPLGDVRVRNTRAALTIKHWAAIQLGHDRYMRVWFAHKLPVPSADMEVSSTGLMVCPLNHPDLPAIAAWHDQAIQLEAKLAAASVAMTSAVDDSSLLPQWPALSKAIGVDHRGYVASRQAKQRFKRLMEGAVYSQQEFDDLLAQGLLLPNLNPPHAWVGLIGR